MIRKPTDRDFKESVAVRVLRESQRVAALGKGGDGRGLRGVGRLGLYGIFWFGVLVTVVPAMLSGDYLPALLFIAGAFGVQQLVRRWFNGSLPYTNRGKSLPPEPADPAAAPAEAGHRFATYGEAPGARGTRQSREYRLSVAAAVRQATSLAIPGAILLRLGIGFVILLIPGLVLFATAILILFKAAFHRDLLSFDHRQVTVNTLLGKRSLVWTDVVDVSARVHSRFNVKVLVTIGTRRAIVVTARHPQGGLTELLIPVHMLDLDKHGLTALVADLIACRAAAGDRVSARQTAPPSPPPEFQPGPSSDPRESFDPDAIIRRHLADRAQLLEEARPAPRPAQGGGMAPPAQFGRKTFGRKMA